MDENESNSPEATPRRSPFWSCLAVFTALLVANIYQTTSILGTRSQLNQTLKNANQRLPEVLVLQNQLEPRLNDFVTDLLQASNTNAASRQLVEQFGVKFNPAATTPPAKSK